MVYPAGTTEGSTVMVKMDPVTFAKRLQEARAKSGLTQQQLADACGLTKGAVSAWENGLTDSILAENLFCVADALRVDPRWLATGHQTETAELDSLTPEAQTAVRALIQSMKR
jgi:transcriptional regulator with XRE-family HTH domain